MKPKEIIQKDHPWWAHFHLFILPMREVRGAKNYKVICLYPRGYSSGKPTLCDITLSFGTTFDLPVLLQNTGSIKGSYTLSALEELRDRCMNRGYTCTINDFD
jgi:hypothetical protein